MYVAPNSTIKFLQNVPLDNTYDHTVLFTSASHQADVFSTFGSTALTLSAQSYVREADGIIRVSLSTAQLYGCNYLMFKNTSFENKWFYAFITKIEYRNNGTSVVHFEIDVMQTWMLNFTVDPCFIEREHSTTDSPGDNLVPENLETGDYMLDGLDRVITTTLNEFPPVAVVFACTFGYVSTATSPADMFPDYKGGTNGGVYSGLALHAFLTIESANTFIDKVVDAKKLSGIVTAFMMYADFVHHDATATFTPSAGSKTKTLYNAKPTTIPNLPSGYTIKNKKLLTYPYIFCYITDNQGNGTAFPFEYFGSTNVQVDLWGSFSPDPAVVLVPKNYKGITDGNWDEKMVLKGFPQVAFNVDAYKAWIAQNGSAMAVSNMSAALSASVGVASGNPMAALGLVNNVMQSVQQMYIHQVQPPQNYGNVSGNVMYQTGRLNFHYGKKFIRPEFALIIDDYFNRFGYATHRVKTPNVFTSFGNRPHWNYVQTKRCALSGNVPADDLHSIANIFDNGITFWKYIAEVGHYNLDNSPGSSV